MLRNNADARRCSYFELGLPVVYAVVVKFTLQCRCRVSFKFFVGLFVVNKCVHFLVLVCQSTITCLWAV